MFAAERGHRHGVRLPRPFPRRHQRRHQDPRPRLAVRRRRRIVPALVHGDAQHTGMGISVKNEYTGGVALSYGIVPQKFDVVGELYGLMGPNSFKIVGGALTNDKLGPAAEVVGGIKLFVERNSYLMLGGGGAATPTASRPRHARVHRLHLRAVDRRPRRRRLQGRRRQVPGRARGLRRLPGRGRLPRSGQRQRRHPRRRRSLPERARGPRRRPGRRRLPRGQRRRSRRRRHPRLDATSAPTIPRTATASRTRTAAPIPTTTRTASPTSDDRARTIPRTRTASRTRTAAPIRTTTRTASPTSRTSARTSRRPTTASRTKTAAPTRAASSSQGNNILILDKIKFETDSAEILPESNPILDAVATDAQAQPRVPAHRGRRATPTSAPRRRTTST